MKIYIAAPFSLKMQIREFAEKFTAVGHTVVSSWVYGDETWEDEDTKGNLSSQACFDEILSCDTFVFFSPAHKNIVENFSELIKDFSNPHLILRKAGVTGGKDVELGVALATNKQIYGIGDITNVFHQHPSIEWCENFGEVLNLILGQPKKYRSFKDMLSFDGKSHIDDLLYEQQMEDDS